MKCFLILVILLVLYHVGFIVAHPTGDGETKVSVNVNGPEGAKLSGNFKGIRIVCENFYVNLI